MNQEVLRLFPYKLFVSDNGKYMFTSKNNRLLRLKASRQKEKKLREAFARFLAQKY